MQVNTTRFGLIEVKAEELISFPWGIPGFEELKGYILLEYKDGPFQWLQSTEEPSVAFVVCPPGFIGLEYSVPESKTSMIKLENPADLIVLNIVSFDKGKGSMRFHVKSPLIFNVAQRLGYQWTMEGDEMKGAVKTPAGQNPDADAEKP
ncbi:MAG: flagellar assembly protein FliW [Desulfobacteraceae bacterium]|nr:flagellar assembly protein FliW [Desulfobacteraceae bacterium]